MLDTIIDTNIFRGISYSKRADSVHIFLMDQNIDLIIGLKSYYKISSKKFWKLNSYVNMSYNSHWFFSYENLKKNRVFKCSEGFKFSYD